MTRYAISLQGRLTRILRLGGFIAAPGALSLCGLATAAATILFDRAAPDFARAYGVSPEIAREMLSTLAGAAMTALGLVYSITLVVFTLAAGSIAPRLLERFSKDRVSHFAIGALGALFLHALTTLVFSSGGPVLAPVAVAGLMALSSILLLILFVDRIAKRVTIDEEIAAIAKDLDQRIADMAAMSSAVDRSDLVLPEGDEVELRAETSGYVDAIASAALAERAAARGGVVDLAVGPGDHVLKGDRIGRVIGPDAEALAAEALASVTFGGRRTQEGDLRFSVSLLLEIALRALSPGVNDSFTAITCMDRLAASFAEAGARGLNPGVTCDRAGAARVITPGTGLDDLIRFAFAPIRQASRNNLLVSGAALSALRRLAPRLAGAARDAAEREIALILREVKASGALEEDIEALAAPAGR